MIPEADLLQRFLLENLGIRGELLRLHASWRAVLERHHYPDAVRRPLGEALVSAALLSATLKYDGSLTLQVRGNGPIHTLIAQASHDHKVRGLARWHGTPEPGPLTSLLGPSQLVMTIEPKTGKSYQGVVPLEGDSLADAIRHYFEVSEQLPTGLWLAISDQCAFGLLLQRMPNARAEDETDHWERCQMLAQTLEEQEMLTLPFQDLLYRLFHTDKVRLFEPDPVAFRCSCSRTRISATLKALGEEDLNTLIEERGKVEVTCEFCNREYQFDRVDVSELFTEAIPSAAPSQRQ